MPPRSGSVSHGYGSGSSYNQEIVRIPFISIVLGHLYDFLSAKNDVNVPSKRNKQNNLGKKYFFCFHLEARGRKEQDPDPDPYQNVTDYGTQIKLRLTS
jgi:hypothetical protein